MDIENAHYLVVVARELTPCSGLCREVPPVWQPLIEVLALRPLKTIEHLPCPSPRRSFSLVLTLPLLRPSALTFKWGRVYHPPARIALAFVTLVCCSMQQAESET